MPKIRRTLILILVPFVFLIIKPDAQAKIKVAASVPDLAAIAQAVGGDRVEVFSLTLPTQDPHFVDARPHLALQLNRSRLLLTVGLDLEIGWLPVLLTGARNPSIQTGNDGYLDLSSVVTLKEVPRVRLDRSMGDIHPGGNPHYLLDLKNAIVISQAIAQRLTQIDPSGKTEYLQRHQIFTKAAQGLQRRWIDQSKPFRGLPIVAYHKSWIYLADMLGLRIVENLEPKPGIPPSAAHVLAVIQTMRREKVLVILQEEYYPDRTAKLVAEKTGAKLLILPGGTKIRNGQTYLERMDVMLKTLIHALKSQQGGSP